MIKELSHTFAAQFYQLDRELFPRQQADRSSIVLFTSSHFGEGVTSVTLAFAMFLAKIHDPEKVIAVEANLREPSFARILGLTSTATIDISAQQGITQDFSLERNRSGNRGHPRQPVSLAHGGAESDPDHDDLQYRSLNPDVPNCWR